jgi:hypothetical protein
MKPIKKTPELEEICNSLSGCLPDWDKIVGKYIRISCGDGDTSKGFKLDRYAGKFAEIHLNNLLRVDSRIDWKPNLPFVEFKDKETYCIYGPWDNLIFIRNEKYLREHDAFAVINDLPVVFEVSIGRMCTEENKKCKLKKRIDVMKIGRSIKLVSSLYSGDVGYVIVTPTDTLTTKDSSFNNFLEYGGLHIPMYTTRKGFLEDCEKVVENYGFKVRE